MRPIHEIIEEHKELELALHGKPGERLSDLVDEESPEVESQEVEEADGEVDNAVPETGDEDLPGDPSVPVLEDPDEPSPGDAAVMPDLGDDEQSVDELPTDEVENVSTPGLEQQDDQQPSAPEFDEEDAPDVTTPELSDPEDQQTSAPESDDYENPEVSTPDEEEPEKEAVTTPSLDDYESPFQTVPDMDDLPEMEVSSVAGGDASEAPSVQPTGFQGFEDLPAVTQTEMDRRDREDNPSLTFEERSERQYEHSQQMNTHLAEELSRELGPSFDEMRQHQSQTVHDYVLEQQMLQSFLRAGS